MAAFIAFLQQDQTLFVLFAIPVDKVIWYLPKTYLILHISHNQCDQIGRFIGLWGNFESLWQQLISPNLPHFQAIFVKVSKFIIFSSEIIFGQLLQTFGDFFWSHWSYLADQPLGTIFEKINCTELFSRTAQLVNCCVHAISKQCSWQQFLKDNLQNCLTMWRHEPSSPSTKSLHGMNFNNAQSYLYTILSYHYHQYAFVNVAITSS